jgi:hypothetical protein
MELLFDTTRTGDDVRNKTQLLVALTLSEPSKPVKTVLFAWGSFLFVGQIRSLSENIDFFSEEGTPLRATMTLGMKEIKPMPPGGSGGGAGAGFGASASFGASAGASFGASASAGASFGASASAGASFGAGASAGPPR